ncbi:MAG: LamG domain-containing protein [Lentisphaeraceae bacterium]|nr:LamG domain-containing protein [Lentisphaeraceae bacterium]
MDKYLKPMARIKPQHHLKTIIVLLFSLILTSAYCEQVLPAFPKENLIAFWDFSEQEAQPRVAKNNKNLILLEQTGKISYSKEGPFNGSATIKVGQWFKIDRDKIGALDIHGPDAKVTVIAWVKKSSNKNWQAIAGVWDESRKKRQYCLFANASKETNFRTLTRVPSKNKFQGHISAVGGPTPGKPYCFTYATSGTELPLNSWECIALTYDSKYIRLYHNGTLSSAEGMNPFLYEKGIFDGKKEGSDFTVGSVSVNGKPYNFFGGSIAGLLVYKDALSAEALKDIFEVGKKDLENK